MRFLPLVWRNLTRKKVRALLTLLSIAVAFLLFGYLAAIRQAFSQGVDVAGVDRLVVRHRVSLIRLLPASYEERIESIPGVVDAVYATWFGGVYQDPKNFFGQFPVDPEEYLSMFPEFLLPEDQKAAWIADRTGAIAGRNIADRFGWKVGDRIPIQATVWRKKDGSATWEFDLVGIYDGAEPGTDTTQFLFHYDYFDEARLFGQGQVGWYTVRVADPERSAEVARRIDEEFENSSAETRTETEKAFVQGFANQVGNVGAILVAILSAVFFTILLVAGNTMAQAVRERLQELALLKALGFSHGGVLVLVLAESCVLAVLGGTAGLWLAWFLISFGDPTGGALPIFFLPTRDLVSGGALVLGLGVVAGILPAMQAMRLRIADGLRRAP
jgi:putative ABC transport system permease protein